MKREKKQIASESSFVYTWHIEGRDEASSNFYPAQK